MTNLLRIHSASSARRLERKLRGVRQSLQNHSFRQITDPIASEPLLRRFANRGFGFFWEVAIGVLTSLLPLSIMFVLLSQAYLPAVAMFSVILAGLVAYAVGWRAGFATTATAAIILAAWMAEPARAISVPDSSSDRTLLLATLLSSGVLILLVERLKIEGSIDRQEALAARSAATALAAVETVAATRQQLTPQARTQLFDAIVRSVVGVNRAHSGSLLLLEEDASLSPVASYGFGPVPEDLFAIQSAPQQLAGRVYEERRVLQMSGLQRAGGDQERRFRQTRIRSLLAAPVIGDHEEFLGVLMVGLLVDHRFDAQAVRKLDALASQVASILETMSAVGRRDFQLQQAQGEQRRLERVVAAVPEALVVTSPPSGMVIAMNTAAHALFGDIPDQDVAQHVRIADPEAASMLTPTEISLTFGEVANDVECVIVKSDGREIPVLASAAPIHDDSGSVVAVVSAYRDITALKEASRLKDEFVSVVSHELRSPLTPIRGFVQLVARELQREGGHDVQVQRLESVSGHVDRLTRLVDDLLDVSRLRSGSLEIRAEPTELVALCQDIVESYQTQVSTHSIRPDLPSETITGEWDRDRIHQVLDNLIQNANKYSPAGSTTVLRLFEQSGEAVIEIIDQGTGIDEEQRNAIFGAFYRTPIAAASQVQGLGLGLFITRALVEAHGGSISVAPGVPEGSVFTIRLPGANQTNHDRQADPDPTTAISSLEVESASVSAHDTL